MGSQTMQGSDGSGSGSDGGSNTGSDGSDGGGELGLDAAAGAGGNHNPNGFDDKTNFYTCAHCGTADPGSGVLLIAGVAFVLRRRRR